MNPYRTIYHRDGTVTLWDVYAQQWIRTDWPSDSVLASFMPEARLKICRHLQRVWIRKTSNAENKNERH